MTIPYKSYLVANQRVGQDLGLDPWLIPQDAYQSIEDAYQYLGVINKRDGYEWFDAVPHALDGGAGNHYQNIALITNGPNSTVTTTANHGLSTGQTIRLTSVDGLSGSPYPVNGTRWTITNTGNTTFTINNAVAFTGVYTNATGTVSTIASPAYPGLPIMAIANWIDSNNNTVLIVLDTRRASIYDSTQGCLIPIGYQDQFSGSQSQYFWWENYFGYIFFTNNKDNIFYWKTDPPVTVGNLAAFEAGLVPFKPQYISGDNTKLVTQCLMIKAVNQRLCLYNTTEADGTHPTRVRWCQAAVAPVNGAQNPDLGSTFWYEDTPGTGGDYFDVTDSLYIITLVQIQNNILFASQNQVFANVYEQRNSSDPNQPFVFVKIATSRNVNSTFGTINLDREVQFVGNTGLILCDGNSVYRYDEKIPNFAMDNIDQNNINQCFGVRNDKYWQTWLLYTPNAIDDTDSDSNPPGQNSQILVFNYLDRAWQTYNINMCCLGITPSPVIDPTWASYNGVILPDWTWEDFGNATWASVAQQASPITLGGDYIGNVWWMDQGGGDAANNVIAYAPDNDGIPITMQLITRQWYPFAAEAKAAQFGYVDLLIDGDITTTGTVAFNVDNQSIDYLTVPFVSVPLQNIQFSTISNVTQANPAIVTSEDHGLVTNQQIWIYGVQGMTELNGNYYFVTVIDANNFSLIGVDSSTFGEYTSSGVVTQQEINESTFWTRIYCGETGVFHTMTITVSGIDESFALHAVMPSFKPTGRIYKA